MKIEDFTTFRFRKGIGILFLVLMLFCSCTEKLSEKRAVELVRLNYRQLSTTEGAGHWILDTVIVKSIIKMKTDSTEVFEVIAFANGLFQFPVAEGSPSGYSENFLDTVRFVAKKRGKVWLAEDWTIIGASNN